MRHTQLRSFHAVAQGGSFTAAAKALGVIAADGHDAGQVARDASSVSSCSAGAAAGSSSPRAAAACSTSPAACRPTRRRRPTISTKPRELKTGHLRVGAVGPYHVTDMLAAFNARHPGLYVSVAVGNSRQTLADLLDYRTDVAVLAHVDPDPRLVAIPYRRHKVVAFCPADHAFARRRSIRLRDLGGSAHDRARGGLDDAPRLRAGAGSRRRSATHRDGDRQPRNRSARRSPRASGWAWCRKRNSSPTRASGRCR